MRQEELSGGINIDRSSRLLRELLDSYARQHADLQNAWDKLENKAQASVGIAGIFLGGTLSFTRDPKATPTTTDRAFAAIIVALVALAIISAGRAMRIRTIPQPALGSNVAPMIDALLSAGERDEQEERELNLLRDWRSMWEKTNSNIEGLNATKAKAVAFAQLALFLATLVAAAWAITSLFSR